MTAYGRLRDPNWTLGMTLGQLVPLTALVAVVFKSLPERVDLVYAVLSSAGLGSLLGSGFGAVRGVPSARRARYAERTSLVVAAIGLVAFVLGAIGQALT